MRLCRYEHHSAIHIGIYDEQFVVPLAAAAHAFATAANTVVELPTSDRLIDFLPPDGSGFESARRVAAWAAESRASLPAELLLRTDDVQLLVPICHPHKILLLAGNYLEHIKEGGGMATERAETFPYVFMKPWTTLRDPGQPVVLPAVSPATIDWECELAVIIGRQAKRVSEAEALSHVAGYMVLNDISNRKYRPNPGRKKRERDAFFDWQHGKWFDTFCPCGPCIASADSIPDPQTLAMQLRLNGEVRQDSSTAAMIFPVAAVIEFISAMVTLEPGDIISTGTPAGVGNTTGTYLKPGDRLDAWIAEIGTLTSPVVAEA